MSTSFVDFQNVYDSVRPDSLKHKLEQLGIKWNFLDIITLLYSSTKVSLFFNIYVSNPCSTSIGLKQGGILTKMFFNLFIDDLSMLLEKYNAQHEERGFPELFNTHIISLLFVDDSEILSFSKNELHEKLEKYCRQWDLNLNLKKTKIIKLYKQCNTIKFHYRGKEI